MKTSLFDFVLPDLLIADHPANPRDAARMLVVADALKDSGVKDLPSFLKPGDIMVFNNTKVIPARLFGKRGDATIEVLLHKHVRADTWQCFVKPAKKLKAEDTLHFADGFFASVKEKLPDGQVVLVFTCEGAMLRDMLARHGHMPLPPYIDRADEATDKTGYQTVYAKHEGSVAAPTAGLHFTDNLLAAIEAKGIKREEVTLHVGGGTFLPVKSDDTKDHVMHSEWAYISSKTADIINQARMAGGRVIAVGTTALRTLETATDQSGQLLPFEGETDIFITPGYRFKAVDVLLTNFHLPKSTLFMLVCAFAGMERMKQAYSYAIDGRYRFYSYGDACLLYPSG